MRKVFEHLLVTIGAMKAGTSWLYMNLKEHPDIECPPVKETSFFWDVHGDFRSLTYPQRVDTLKYNLPRILSHTEPSKAGALLDWFGRYMTGDIDDYWFVSLFPERKSKRVSADFSNLYSRLGGDVWRHMRELSDNLRIIYMIRSPLDRLWSHTKFHVQFTEHGNAFADWSSQQFRSFILEHGLDTDGRYAETISRLRQMLFEDELKVLYYERIGSEPLAVMRDVETFVGVGAHDYDDGSLSEVHNGSRRQGPPPAFYGAAIPLVQGELDAMRRASLHVPEGWLSDLAEARLKRG